MSWLSKVLDALASILPDLVGAWLAARRERKALKAKKEDDLKNAIDSGDPDAVADALRRRLRE